LHAYKAVDAHGLEQKHGGGRTCLKECLKRQQERKKKRKKDAKEGEVNGLKRDRMAMTSKSFGVPCFSFPSCSQIRDFVFFFSYFFASLSSRHPLAFHALDLPAPIVLLFIPDLGQSRTR